MAGDWNRRIWERRAVVARYGERSQLQPVESEIFRRYKAEIAGARTLDLGAGAGRTTPFLLDLSSQYVGVDYSAEMVDRCRERFPTVDFEVVDARDLSRFSDASFDFVLFSYNGLDEMGHADRLKVLREIRRVLGDVGLFVFSSHNRDFPIPKPWDLHHLAVSPLKDPVDFGKRLISYPMGIVNFVRHSHRAEEKEEYSVLVDVPYRYSLVHYHIRPDAQALQLQRAGFTDVEAFGADGHLIAIGACEVITDPWIYYACRKGSEPQPPQL